MKAITIAQPYPHLICLPETDPRHKRVENRTWSTTYRGPLAIHAGLSRDWIDHGEDDNGREIDDRYEIPIDVMVFGAVVAIAQLIDCLQIVDIQLGKHDRKHPWLRVHDHTSGPWCWVLQEVRPLAKPIPYRGAQGLWTFDERIDIPGTHTPGLSS